MERNPYQPPQASLGDTTPLVLRSAQPINRKRIFIGLVAATLVATLGIMCVVWLGSTKPLSLRSTFAALSFNLVLVALVTGILVLPLYLLLKRLNLACAWSAGLAGFLMPALGFVAFILVARNIPSIGPVSLPVFRLSILCFAGAAAGLAFWFIAEGWARPNTTLERTRER